MIKNFKITVTQLVDDADLDHDDIDDNPKGDHVFNAESEEEALDVFHWNVPIACLDHFDIECHQI